MQLVGKSAPLVGVLLMALTPLIASEPPSSDPLCGTTITEDLVLDHNVVCYNRSGITVEAENVTVDLNGKAILCHNGVSLSCSGASTIGIDASRVNRVIIKGPGTVFGFGLQFVSAVDVNSNARLRPASNRRSKENPKKPVRKSDTDKTEGGD